MTLSVRDSRQETLEGISENMTSIIIQDCPNIQKLPNIETSKSSLQLIEVRNCKSFNDTQILNYINFIKLVKLIINKTKLTELQLKMNPQITFIQITECNLTDLQMLQNFTQLSHLDVKLNNISNLESLRNLVQLQFLDVGMNDISSIEPLRDLASIQHLSVSCNQLWNIVELQIVQGMTNLRYLDITDNDMLIQHNENIKQVLASILPESVEELYVYDKDDDFIEDLEDMEVPEDFKIAPLTLKEEHSKFMSQYYKRVNDNSFVNLNHIPQCVKHVVLIRCQKLLTLDGIERLSENLQTLLVFDGGSLKDCSALQKCPYEKMTKFEVEGSEVLSSVDVSNLTNLEIIKISRTKVSDIESFRNLKKLRIIRLAKNQVNNIEPLMDLANIVKLVLKDNRIDDIEQFQAFENMKKLEYLDVRGNCYFFQKGVQLVEQLLPKTITTFLANKNKYWGDEDDYRQFKYPLRNTLVAKSNQTLLNLEGIQNHYQHIILQQCQKLQNLNGIERVAENLQYLDISNCNREMQIQLNIPFQSLKHLQIESSTTVSQVDFSKLKNLDTLILQTPQDFDLSVLSQNQYINSLSLQVDTITNSHVFKQLNHISVLKLTCGNFQGSLDLRLPSLKQFKFQNYNVSKFLLPESLEVLSIQYGVFEDTRFLSKLNNLKKLQIRVLTCQHFMEALTDLISIDPYYYNSYYLHDFDYWKVNAPHQNPKNSYYTPFLKKRRENPVNIQLIVGQIFLQKYFLNNKKFLLEEMKQKGVQKRQRIKQILAEMDSLYNFLMEVI